MTVYCLVDKSRQMDVKDATLCFAALSQETRLAVFRLLVAAPAVGVSAGDVARQIGVPHNTMSTHLGILLRAGLVTVRRDGRSMLYAAHHPGIRALIGFMLEDCCQGRPELCAPMPDCCPPMIAGQAAVQPSKASR